MTQGNPFGNKGGQWMPDAVIRVLADERTEYDVIADVNLVLAGWRPSKSAVLRRLRSMDVPRRRAVHHDLIPWRIAPDHSDDLERHWLGAESRSRQGLPLSDTDRKLVRNLHETIGTRLVIAYDPTTGFHYARRLATDEDIIRWPSDPALLRKDLPPPTGIVLETSSVTPAWVDQSDDHLMHDRSEDPDYSEREPDDMVDWSCRDCGWRWPYIATPSTDTECEMCGGELTNRG